MPSRPTPENAIRFLSLSPRGRFSFTFIPFVLVLHHYNGSLCISYAYPETVDVTEDESDGEKVGFEANFILWTMTVRSLLSLLTLLGSWRRSFD